jgi:hypothetical protein
MARRGLTNKQNRAQQRHELREDIKEARAHVRSGTSRNTSWRRSAWTGSSLASSVR